MKAASCRRTDSLALLGNEETMINPTWAERQVIQSAGIRLEDADDQIVALAKEALDRCYYIDQAAKRLLRMLHCRAHR